MARASKQTTAKKTNATKTAAKRSTTKSAQPKSSGTKITASKATAKTVKAPVSRNSASGKQSEPIKISRDQVAARAYQIWVEKGQPAGQDEINWQEAEKELGFAA